MRMRKKTMMKMRNQNLTMILMRAAVRKTVVVKMSAKQMLKSGENGH
jgi:hypothetical protein